MLASLAARHAPSGPTATNPTVISAPAAGAAPVGPAGGAGAAGAVGAGPAGALGVDADAAERDRDQLAIGGCRRGRAGRGCGRGRGDAAGNVRFVGGVVVVATAGGQTHAHGDRQTYPDAAPNTAPARSNTVLHVLPLGV